MPVKGHGVLLSLLCIRIFYAYIPYTSKTVDFLFFGGKISKKFSARRKFDRICRFLYNFRRKCCAKGAEGVNIRLYAVRLDRALDEAETAALARFLPSERKVRSDRSAYTAETLCAYALLRRALPKRPAYLYVSLILAMLLGRVAWGVARLALAGLNNGVFTFAEFLAGAFTSAIPGIICHILIIPPLAMALERVRGRAAA